MPAQQLNKIFLGHTPAEQRKYLTEVFKHLKDKYPKLVIPAVGQFTLVKCAISAGYERENIYTSDYSLYSSLLGYLFSGKPIDDLKFELAEQFRSEYELVNGETKKVAYIFWVMKLAQMSKVHYQKLMYEDLLENKQKHISHIENQIKEMKDYFSGVNYEIKDLRDEFVKREDDTLLVINPPVFKKGYTKMFDFTGYIEYNSNIEEFDWKKEYHQLYENSKLLNYPVIWYRFRDAKGFDEKEIMFAKEYEVEKQDYWLITKPEVIEGFKYYKNIASFRRKNFRPYHLPIFSGKDRMDENSKVKFVSVQQEVGLYYRDLFAHRLGNTGAEHYFLLTIDDKVFSTCGFTTSKLFRLQTDYVFENFGFSVSHKEYPHANRLLMLMITSKEFKDVIYHKASNKNRIYNLNGLKTTCLSKYRSIKTHQGILHRMTRELMPNGMYKITAGTTWHNRDFKETLKVFLEENKLGRKILTTENVKTDTVGK